MISKIVTTLLSILFITMLMYWNSNGVINSDNKYSTIKIEHLRRFTFIVSVIIAFLTGLLF